MILQMIKCDYIYLTNSFISLGFLLFKQYCEEISDEPIPQLGFYEEVKHNQLTLKEKPFVRFLDLES